MFMLLGSWECGHFVRGQETLMLIQMPGNELCFLSEFLMMCWFQELRLKQCLQKPTGVLKRKNGRHEMIFCCTLFVPSCEITSRTLRENFAGIRHQSQQKHGYSFVTMITDIAILRCNSVASITGFCWVPLYLLATVTSARHCFCLHWDWHSESSRLQSCIEFYG